jgi:hypothetical protein
MRPLVRYHAEPLVFWRGARVRTYRPTDKVQATAIRAAMRRHGWRAVPATPGARPSGDGARHA